MPSLETLSYLERRAKAPSKILRTDFPQHSWLPIEVPDGVEEVYYPSGTLKLKAWLHVPKEGTKPFPALVYLHSGFEFHGKEYNVCKPFLDAGYVIFCPTFRGKNGNPGDFELLYGEADDAAAAVRWLAKNPVVDRNRIYVFGTQEGGAIAALLSLFDDLPAQHTCSYDGIITEDQFVTWAKDQLLPFHLNDVEEYRARMLLTNLKDMKRRHYAYISHTENDYADMYARANREWPLKKRLLELTFLGETGNIETSKALPMYLRRIQTNE